MVRLRKTAIQAALDLVRGRVQMTVRFRRPAPLLEESPNLAPAGGSGTAYLRPAGMQNGCCRPQAEAIDLRGARPCGGGARRPEFPTQPADPLPSDRPRQRGSVPGRNAALRSPALSISVRGRRSRLPPTYGHKATAASPLVTPQAAEGRASTPAPEKKMQLAQLPFRRSNRCERSWIGWRQPRPRWNADPEDVRRSV